MDQLPVYYYGKRVGHLEIERDGLYLCVHSQCSLVESEEVLRLWAVGGEERVYLGIPVPEGDHLVLRRRLPAGSLGQTVWAHGVLGTAPDLWQPYSGIVAGYAVRRGLRRLRHGYTEIALPFERGQPVSFLPLLPRLRLERIDGALWFVLRTGTDDT